MRVEDTLFIYHSQDGPIYQTLGDIKSRGLQRSLPPADEAEPREETEGEPVEFDPASFFAHSGWSGPIARGTLLLRGEALSPVGRPWPRS